MTKLIARILPRVVTNHFGFVEKLWIAGPFMCVFAKILQVRFRATREGSKKSVVLWILSSSSTELFDLHILTELFCSEGTHTASALS